MALLYPTQKNAIQKTLDSSLLAGATTMTLNNIASIQNKAGVCVVDRVDANGVSTPTKREYISFTGASGATLTGLTRNADGSGTDQDHAVGAIVEFVSDILQQQAIIDALLAVVTTAGAVDTTKVVTLTATQALTNKTLTAPTVTTGTFASPVLTTPTVTTSILPTSNDGAPIGSTAAQFSDLFLAEGGVINWDNGDATLTQAGDVVTLAGAALKVSSPGTATGSAVTVDGTQTLSVKRITKRVGASASAATHTIDSDAYDVFTVTAQAEAVTFGAPSGTPTSGQTLVIRVLDNGTARAITWNAAFRASTDLALPTTTVLSKTLYCGFMWNAAASKWDLLAYINNY